MEQLSLMDYKPPAITARDAALAQVEANNLEWAALALIQFKQLYLIETDYLLRLTGEQIRHRLIPYVGKPKHSNAWGGFIMRLLRSGLIEKTGEYVSMCDKRSHARATAVYRLGSV